MHLAVDRTEFRTIWGGGIAPVGTPFPPDTWFGRTTEEALQLPGFRSGPNGEKHPDDIAEARRLLAEAGVPEGFKVDIMARTAVEYVDLAQLLADQMRRFLGWDATVQTIDSATGLTRYKEHDYQIGAQGTALLPGRTRPNYWQDIYAGRPVDPMVWLGSSRAIPELVQRTKSRTGPHTPRRDPAGNGRLHAYRWILARCSFTTGASGTRSLTSKSRTTICP